MTSNIKGLYEAIEFALELSTLMFHLPNYEIDIIMFISVKSLLQHIKKNIIALN